MWLSKYFCYFIIFSVLGWIYETIYCTIKERKWENRGFLYGPVCPIYGTGGVIIIGLTDLLTKNGISFAWWQVFLISVVGSAVLEYSTSWTLEKLFHAYWWDYSSQPLNLHGRICLFCSLAFGFAGVLIVYVLAPFVVRMTSWISPIGYELLGLLFISVLASDTTLTVVELKNFEKQVAQMNDEINTYMEQFVQNLMNKAREDAAMIAELKERESFLERMKALASEREVEERERFFGEHKVKWVNSMGVFAKSAARRTRGFHRKKSELPSPRTVLMKRIREQLNQRNRD